MSWETSLDSRLLRLLRWFYVLFFEWHFLPFPRRPHPQGLPLALLFQVVLLAQGGERGVRRKSLAQAADRARLRQWVGPIRHLAMAAAICKSLAEATRRGAAAKVCTGTRDVS